MKGYLLDVNLLIALLWARHEHHDAAQRWFSEQHERRWATCAVTQLGFVRIVSNAAFSRDAIRPEQALRVLEANLRHPSHEEWRDRWGATNVLSPLAGQLVGHRQITDLYLLGLAAKYGGRLATFDRGIDGLAISGSSVADAVERVSIL